MARAYPVGGVFAVLLTGGVGRDRMTDTRLARAVLILLAAGLCLLGTPLEALAHGVTAGDKGYIQEV